MPPKKKKDRKLKGSGSELSVDDKYKKTLEEVEALKDHLAVRKELARRSKEASEEWKERMLKAEVDLEEVKDTHRAISADMTRQYKTMQLESGHRIQQLETELAQAKAKLERTEYELQRTKEDKDRILKEKELQVETLNMKVSSMSSQYEYLFNEFMDKLVDKLAASKNAWEKEASNVLVGNKQLLLEFGINSSDF